MSPQVPPEDAAANQALLKRMHEAGVTLPLELLQLAEALPAHASARDPAVAVVVEQAVTGVQRSAARAVSRLVAENPTLPFPALFRALLAACDAEDARRVALSEEGRATLPPVTAVAGVKDGRFRTARR